MHRIDQYRTLHRPMSTAAVTGEVAQLVGVEAILIITQIQNPIVRVPPATTGGLANPTSEFRPFWQFSQCACAETALILLPVYNLTPEIDSAHQITYMMWIQGENTSFGGHFGPFWSFFHCACAETAQILLPVCNLTPEIDSAHQITYRMWIWGENTSFGGHFGPFQSFFLCACAETALKLLPVCNLTPEIDSAHQITYRMWIWGENTSFGGHFGPFQSFFLCACAETAIKLLPVCNLTPEIDSAHQIPYMMWNWGEKTSFGGSFGLFCLQPMHRLGVFAP